MAFAKVTGAAKSNTDGNFAFADTATAPSSAVDTTGSKLFIAAVINYSAGASSQLDASNITDTGGNTWTPLTIYSSGGDPRIRLYYVINPTTNASHTFRFDPSVFNNYPSIYVLCFSADGTVTYDSENGAGLLTNVTSAAAGSIIPAADNELLITFVGLTTASTNPTIDSSYTLDNYINGGSGQYTIGAAYQIQTTATTRNPTWSWTTNCNGYSIGHAAFKNTVTATGHNYGFNRNNLRPKIFTPGLAR